MASNRKKQDDKHLRILRNLVSSPGNKQCFDCNQRGPTYVNVTIGSFVCTTCSGLLRGLTPPHRVKSISMATFTPEEIESLQSKGNEYCKKVWLALYDSDNIQNTKDEHLVLDFMIAKYEKKLYYMEPSKILKNGNQNSSFSTQSVSGGIENLKTQNSIPNSSLLITTQKNSKPLQSQNANTFASNIVLSDPFKANPVQSFHQKNQIKEWPPQNHEPSFANFDNNPIFNSTNTSSTSSFSFSKPLASNEDKYAALKDLDCLMKMQQGSPQSQGSLGNGWPQNNTEKNVSSNPFQVDIGNNNVVINPFRSGLIHQVEANGSLNNNSCGNDNTINGYGNNSMNSINPDNPWSSRNLWNNSASVTTNSSFSSSFQPFEWSGKGNLTMIPGNSNNPFL